MGRIGRKLFSAVSMLTYLSQIFMVQSSWAGESFYAPTDPRTIVTLLNLAGTPKNLIQIVRVSVGPAAAVSLEKAFVQNRIKLTDQIPKVTLKNGEIFVEGSETPALGIVGGDQPTLTREGVKWVFDAKKSFGQNLDSFKKLVASKGIKTESSFFRTFAISEARADDSEAVQNEKALSDSQTRKSNRNWTFVGLSIFAIAAVVVFAAPVVGIATGIAIGVGLLAAGFTGYHHTKYVLDNSPSFSCHLSTNNEDLKLQVGGVTLVSSVDHGRPKSVDVYVDGKVTSTYFVGNNWDVMGMQEAGKSAQVPLQRQLTEQEKVLMGEMKELASACSHPEQMAKIQTQLKQVQAELRGTGGSAPSQQNGNAGRASLSEGVF